MAAAVLPLAIPAALTAAYLDARHLISNDVHLLSSLIRCRIGVLLAERSDTVNAFYHLEAAAKANPTRVFLWYNDIEYTYAQTYDIVLKHATWFSTVHGVKKGDVVALDFMNNDDFLFLWFGLWALGAHPAFVNYNLRGAALLHCVTTSGAKIVIVDPEVESANGEKGVSLELSALEDVSVVVFGATVKADVAGCQAIRPGNEQRSGAKGHHLAMLIYTSGTTGLPKPAVVSWWKCTGAPRFGGLWMGLKPTDRYYTCMPVYHGTAALVCVLTCLQTRATLCLGHKFSAKGFFPEVARANATVIQYVGETCRYLLATPPSPADTAHNVRKALGNGLRADVWREFKQRFHIDTIAEFYSATEGSGGSFHLQSGEFGIGAIGKTGTLLNLLMGPGQAIVEVDTETETIKRDPVTGFCTRMPVGEPGEMLYKLNEKNIEQSFQGYYNNAKASQSKVMRDVFKKGDAWFRTGDILSKTSEGLTFFNDRIGDTYRWKSENVSTTEVSNTLNLHPTIADSAVYGVPLPHHDGNVGVAAVVLSSSQDPQRSLDELLEYLNKSLPKYAIPVFLRIVDEVERTGNNKVMKAGLRKEGVKPENNVKDVWWLKGGRYTPFGKLDWEELNGGRAKL